MSTHPLGRLGVLELLVDARRTFANDGFLLTRLPDFSAHGTNWLDNGGGTGLMSKLDAINHRPAFRVADTFTGQGAPGRSALSRALTGPLTIIAVAQWHAVGGGANRLLCDYLPLSTGSGLALNCGTTAALELQAINAGSRSSISGGTLVAESPALIVGVIDGVNSLLRINRAQVAASNLATPPGCSGFQIGSASGGGADMNGLLGILALFRGALTLDRIVAAEAALDREYALGLGAI